MRTRNSRNVPGALAVQPSTVSTMKRFVLLAPLICACSNPTAPTVVAVPPFVDSLPASVTVSNATLNLESSAWRDFMPGQTDDRMVVVLRVRSSAGQSLPAGLTVDRAWIVHRAEAWTTTPLQEQPSSATTLEVVARQGPRWPTGDSVFVAIEFHVAGSGPYRMRGPGQVLQRTD